MSGINYRLNINRSAKDFKYRFSYGNTQNIKLALNKSGVALSVNLTKENTEDIENPYLYGLFKKGIKVKKLWESVIRKDMNEERCNSLSDFIREKIIEYGSDNFDVTPYGFMLTDFPYHLRCNLFHAGRPVQLFRFKNDMELKFIRIVNSLFEMFLDQNFHGLFMNNNSDSVISNLQEKYK